MIGSIIVVTGFPYLEQCLRRSYLVTHFCSVSGVTAGAGADA